MKIKRILLPLLLCLMLLLTACGKTTPDISLDNIVSMGQGGNSFIFVILDEYDNQFAFEVHTDKTYVGEALSEMMMISGEEGPYGLFVDTVYGRKLDYETDGLYWAFYIDGAYATKGVDDTKIEKDCIYMMKAEK